MFLHRIGFQTQKFNFLFILEFLSCLKAFPEVKQQLLHLNYCLILKYHYQKTYNLLDCLNFLEQQFEPKVMY